MHLEWPVRIAESSAVKASIILLLVLALMIALGHNLGDMAQTVLMNMANADIERTSVWRPPPPRLLTDSPRIVPLRCARTRGASLRLHRDLPLTTRNAQTLVGLFAGGISNGRSNGSGRPGHLRHGLVRMADQIKGLRDQIVDLGGQGQRPAPPTPCPAVGVQVQARNARLATCEICSVEQLEHVADQFVKVLRSSTIVAPQFERDLDDFQTVGKGSRGLVVIQLESVQRTAFSISSPSSMVNFSATYARMMATCASVRPKQSIQFILIQFTVFNFDDVLVPSFSTGRS